MEEVIHTIYDAVKEIARAISNDTETAERPNKSLRLFSPSNRIGN